MITIHYRTPNSLELSISAGKHVRHFAAFKRERRWVIEEHRGHEVEILRIATLVAMFLFFSMIEENLLTFQEGEFKE